MRRKLHKTRYKGFELGDLVRVLDDEREWEVRGFVEDDGIIYIHILLEDSILGNKLADPKLLKKVG